MKIDVSELSQIEQDALAEIYRESEAQFEEACQVLLAMKA